MEGPDASPVAEPVNLPAEPELHMDRLTVLAAASCDDWWRLWNQRAVSAMPPRTRLTSAGGAAAAVSLTGWNSSILILFSG